MMFYILDLFIGFGSAVVLFLLFKKGIIRKYIWNLYWLGALTGLLWEIPIFVFSTTKIVPPLIVWKNILPANIIIFIIAHTLWDGLLFLFGVCLIIKINPNTKLNRFNLTELLTLIFWGEVSALMVEVSSTMNNAWSYIEYSWNPLLFKIKGQNITALPQLIWLLAPVLFYCIIVRVRSFQKLDD